MGREPRDYAVWAVVVRNSDVLYTIVVDAISIDQRGQREKLTETKTATSRAEAIELAYEFAREVCQRLAAQGHMIASVQIEPIDGNEGL